MGPTTFVKNWKKVFKWETSRLRINLKICLSFLRDSFLGTYLSYLHQEEDLFNYPPFLCPGSGARLMIRPKRSNHVPFRLFESNDVRFRLFESNDAVFDFFESNDVSFRLFESNDVSNLPDTVRYHGTSSVPRWEAGAKTPTPQFWLPNFSTGSPFAIIFRQPFLADQPQNFYKGAFGANITDFEGVAHAETEKKNVFWPVFEKFRKIKLVDLKRSHGSIFPIPAFQKGRGGGGLLKRSPRILGTRWVDGELAILGLRCRGMWVRILVMRKCSDWIWGSANWTKITRVLFQWVSWWSSQISPRTNSSTGTPLP